MKRILVCTDGEEHTRKAEERALELAERFRCPVTGLYVVSTFLTKFTHEIYAVGRNECRDHLNASFRLEGQAALEALGLQCRERGLDYESRMREGDIAEQIVTEASSGTYDLLVMGAKRLTTLRERLESVNVAQTVFRSAPLPMLFVR